MSDSTRHGGELDGSEWQKEMDSLSKVLLQMPLMPLVPPTDAGVIEQAGLLADEASSVGAVDASERHAAAQDPWDGP
jgi:hypothetical protein